MGKTLDITYDKIRDLWYKLGFNWDDRKLMIHIVGVRGLSVKCDSKHSHCTFELNDNTPNKWNDTILLVYRGVHGEKMIKGWEATIDPGEIPEEKQNPKGIAHIVDLTQYWYYYHHNGHKGMDCLRPLTPIRIDRDIDNDNIPDRRIDQNRTILIHSGGRGKNVNNWSAGCSVIHSPYSGHAYQTFLKTLKTTSRYSYIYGRNVGIYPYFTIDGKELQMFLANPKYEFILKRGMINKLVYKKQKLIQKLGFEIETDGIYGKQTEKYLWAFTQHC